VLTPTLKKPLASWSKSPTRSSRCNDGRIYIELVNARFLYQDRGAPAEYHAGMQFAIERGWLVLHESGTYVKFNPLHVMFFAQSTGASKDE
jgi:hypothetical protein